MQEEKLKKFLKKWLEPSDDMIIEQFRRELDEIFE